MKPLCSIFCAVFMLFSLAGCSAGDKSYNAAASSAAPASADQKYDSATEEAAADTAEMGEADYAQSTANGESQGALGGNSMMPPALNMPGTAGQKIIWRVNMYLETLTFDETLKNLTAEIGTMGGFIESSSTNGQSLFEQYEQMRYAQIVARVPQEKLDAFLSKVGEVCHVTSAERTSENITLRYSDIKARKKALEVEQERLFVLLEKADTMESIVALESRLSEIRYQLDEFSSSLRKYDNEVDFATVSMSLQEVKRVSDPVPVSLSQRVSTGFSTTLYNIKNGAVNLMVWLIVNLPYLLILAAVAVAALFVLRRTHANIKKRAAALPKAAPTAVPGFETAAPPEPKGDNPYTAKK